MKLKDFIFQEMGKKGFVLDKELAKFIKETKGEDYYNIHVIPFCQAENYKREYQALKNAKSKFDNCEDVEINSYKNSCKGAKTRYFLRHKGMPENQRWKIPKIYFDYLKKGGGKKMNINDLNSLETVEGKDIDKVFEIIVGRAARKVSAQIFRDALDKALDYWEVEE